MTAADLISTRFHSDELTVRRLMNRDPVFASLCEDYSTACCAYQRWKDDPAKVEDYRAVIAELEREIARRLPGVVKVHTAGH